MVGGQGVVGGMDCEDCRDWLCSTSTFRVTLAEGAELAEAVAAPPLALEEETLSEWVLAPSRGESLPRGPEPLPTAPPGSPDPTPPPRRSGLLPLDRSARWPSVTAS